MLKEAYGEWFMSRAYVSEWCKRFPEGQPDCVSGCVKSVKREENNT
jgi:hypothetical protein